MENTNKRPAEESLEISEKKQQQTSVSKGVAPIKPEFIISQEPTDSYNDDEAESRTDDVRVDKEMGGDKNGRRKKGKKKERGQNKARDLRQAHETIKLCGSLIDPENTNAGPCTYGAENCKFSHDMDGYLSMKPADVPGNCPVWEALGYCPAGLKCRWLGSHFDSESKTLKYKEGYQRVENHGELNWTTGQQKNVLQKRKMPLPLSDQVIQWLDERNNDVKGFQEDSAKENEKEKELTGTALEIAKLRYLTYVEPPFKLGEKKKLNVKNAKIVSPLTTVGNLPFRRLMKTMGADVTYSEMALTLPLIQGSKSEWALTKAHKSEYPGFGIQLASGKHWQAAKAAEILQNYAPNVSELNLNCGCPIDLLYRRGEGSALLDNAGKMMRILKSMNYCSGEVPVTVKLRMGTRDSKPVAEHVVKRLLKEGDVGAITLHGRSRQQRYTRENNWDFISKVGGIVKDFNESQLDDKDQTDRQPVFFIGNGDAFTHLDWQRVQNDENVDSVMVARGALIKPWIFEEFEAGQYLDKSSTERLAILEQYAKFALEHWGSDDFGVNSARRYMCEFISFTHRYIPVGILERLPPKLNERPPQWKGRDEMETLLGSSDYKDWIKITEMFLGKASEGFTFTPKHKSNSFDNQRN
ncbi:unnamed protein product [Ambrosiozyma monospora]|uniref:tRNA-dihydrouridine(47) synthase [NAD(P)(+)] n=2 Tax=Ambrosiozyma monospora TaxID=43982 RepID=A0A9W7DI05_AMBMO|nr:unnamed protein product [Ambrosiozyma monospora]